MGRVKAVDTAMKELQATAKTTGVALKDAFAPLMIATQAATENARAAAIQLKSEGQMLKDVAAAGKLDAQAMKLVAEANTTAAASANRHATAQKGLYDTIFKTETMWHHMNWLVSGAGLFLALDTLKEGFVDYESALANITTTLPQLHGNMVLANAAGTELLKTTERYGVSLDEVANSARSVSRLYKDTATVLGMVDQITLLNVIDNVNLDNATKGLEATMASFGKGLKNTGEILAFSMGVIDKITTLTHNAFAKGDDLVQILQRAASAAKVAGMSLEELLSIGTTALRSTGLPGGNIGNFMKTIIGTLAAPTDAVKESLDAIGIEATGLDGKLRPVYDIILDISKATGNAKYSQEELTDAIEATSRGVYQWSKLAAVVGNYEEIVRTSALQFKAQGTTMAMAGQQLDTLARKAASLKAVMVDLFATSGNNQIRDFLKDLIDITSQLVLGLKNSGAYILKSVGLYLGLGLAVKTLNGIFKMVISTVEVLTGKEVVLAGQKVILRSATTAVAAATTAEAVATRGATTATNMFTAALARNPIGIIAVALSALIGGLMAYTYHTGQAEKATIDLASKRQAEAEATIQQINNDAARSEWLQTMNKEYNTLKASIDSGTLSEEEAAAAKSKLDAVTAAIVSTLSDEEKQAIANCKTMDESIAKIEELRKKRNEEKMATINQQIADTEATKQGTIERMQAYNNEIQALNALMAAKGSALAQKAQEVNPVGYGSEIMKQSFLYGAATPEEMGLLGPMMPEIEQTAAENVLQAKIAADQSALNQAQADVDAAQQQIQSLMDATKSLSSNVSGVDHGGEGGGSESGGGSGGGTSDFTAPLKESANEAKLAMEGYQDALQMTDLDIAGITARERILDLEIKDRKIPTLEQATQKYSLLNETIAANIAKEEELHSAAEEGRKQLVALNEQRDELIRQHEAGTLSTKEFNAAMQSLSPTIKELEREVKGYSNTWWDAQYAINEAKNAQVDLVREYMKAAREIEAANEKAALEEQRDAELQHLKDLKEAAKEASDAKIQAWQDEIDALDEENDLLEEQNTLNEKIKSLEEAEKKLANVQANKNTRVFQNGKWEYVADPEKVKEAQQALEEAQKAYDETVQEQAKNRRKRELQDQIDAERKKQEAADEAADKQIKTQEDYWKDRIDMSEKKWKILLDDEQLQIDAYNTIVNEGLQTALAKWEEYYRRVKEIQDETGSPPSDESGESSESLPQYAKGGPIYYKHKAIVDPSEYILNASTVANLGGFAGVEKLVAAVKMPSLRTVSNNSYSTAKIDNSSNVNIGSVNVSKVYDTSGFIRNMRRYIS